MLLHFRIARAFGGCRACALSPAGTNRLPHSLLHPKYYSDLSKIDKIELAHVLIRLEELVFMAEEIEGEFPQIERRWNEYYSKPAHSTAAELAKALSKLIDAATTLDRNICRFLVIIKPAQTR